jgi:hypothetical protein
MSSRIRLAIVAVGVAPIVAEGAACAQPSRAERTALDSIRSSSKTLASTSR